MPKSILIISSSPRKGANSDTLCDQFYVGVLDAGHNVEKIFLKDKNINYCTGCGYCNEHKKCSQHDDMAEILEKMVKADVIVLATPMYFYKAGFSYDFNNREKNNNKNLEVMNSTAD